MRTLLLVGVLLGVELIVAGLALSPVPWAALIVLGGLVCAGCLFVVDLPKGTG